MNQTESKTGAERDVESQQRETVTVRIRTQDVKRLERYWNLEDKTPASAVSRVIDIAERDRAIFLKIGELLPETGVQISEDRAAMTKELISKTDELLVQLRSE